MSVRLRPQAGFSFIEVLVAMLILGISVMAFAGLQVRALGTTSDAHLRSQAMSLASEFVERIRANPGQLATYRSAALYDGADAPAGAPRDWPGAGKCLAFLSVANDGCDTGQMARYDINEVEFLAGQLLPNGRIRFATCDGMPGLDCIAIAWRGVDPADCESNATAQCIVMQVAFR